jgi:D-alanyl-D-alanine carboxypeptidase/D-alanyl-D-alanine-endopeptidase (penicillin-binding protein 4)
MLYAYRVPEPQRFAESAFSVALHDAGITIAPSAKPQLFDRAAAAAQYVASNLVAQHVSPPLSEDVYLTLKVSDNLHADMMLYDWALYAAHAKTDFVKTAFSQERHLLQDAGLDLSGASQQDGLGTAAFFAPDFMVHYLAWARTQTWFSAFNHGLPIMGVDGTLFNIQNNSPAKGKVFAKTGTWGSDNALNDDGLTTKGLAGYLTTSHGRHVAFAFYINRMEGRHSVDTAKDGAHTAGEFLGSFATATYLSL